MNSLRVVSTSVAATLLAACGSHGNQAPAKPDPLLSITFKEVTGMLQGADSAQPKCPVRPHFEATLRVSHAEGTLTYRWERSHGDSTTHTIDIPAAAKTAMVELPLQPDEWNSAERGVQLTLTDRVHILKPMDVISPTTDIQAKCY